MNIDLTALLGVCAVPVLGGVGWLIKSYTKQNRLKARLENELLAEQVRELRLKNDDTERQQQKSEKG